MKDYKVVAKEIADKYKFENFDVNLCGTLDSNITNLTKCQNHLDTEFMKSIQNLEFIK